MQQPVGSETVNVLVVPLDWGMGHATRCIPIINQLLACNCRVWLAGEGDTLRLLRQEFPELPAVPLEGYRVRYQKAQHSFSLKLLTQAPKLLFTVRKENRWLQQVLKEHPIDIVISDNRFGLYTTRAYTVFITHQLAIKTGLGKWADIIARYINYRFINRFDVCWIPDYETGSSLAGELSHPTSLPGNCRYIGALSRVERKPRPKQYDLLIVLSGPEPARTDFENKLLKSLDRFRGKVLLVRGTTYGAPLKGTAHISFADLLTADALNDALNAADLVICRSGYTSVMDLVKLRKKAVLVPTPGQPEQEYLARRLHENEIFYSVAERDFELDHVLRNAARFPYTFKQETPELYRSFVDDLLEESRYKLKNIS